MDMLRARHFAPASLLALACAPAGATGFIEDSKATLQLRNVYYSQDIRNQDAPSAREWGQGFLLNLQSGYTEGPVGFGLDAEAFYGLRLDGGGRAGKAGIARTPGAMFPLERDGRAADDFGRLGLTGKLRVSRSVLQLGTLKPRMPVLTHTDRLALQTFEGGQLTVGEIDKLTLVGGLLEHSAERNSSDSDTGLAIAGALDGEASNQFVFAGADYRITPHLTAQYYYGNLEDFYAQHFVGLVHTWTLPAGSLKTDLRYFDSRSDGKNASRGGRAEGYRSAGYWRAGDPDAGEVDNRVASALLTYSLNGHALGLGYQTVSGESDFPHINQGAGRTVYLITNAQVGKFLSAGQDTWVASYAYDFAQIGVAGLKASLAYYTGDGIDAADGSHREWERNLRVDYVLPSGALKGLGITWRNAVLRGNDQRDQDENQLILAYTLPLR